MAIAKISRGSGEGRGTFHMTRRYKAPRERPAAMWTFRANRALGAPGRPGGSTTPPETTR